MMAQHSMNLEGYAAVKQSAAFIPRLQCGVLRLTGPDRIDFIQRQTTNDITPAEPGYTPRTVLTSPTARILDVFTVLHEGEALIVLPLPGRASDAAAYLKGKIFFMDKVEVEDVSDEFVQIDLEGPLISESLTNLGLDSAPSLNHSLRFTFADNTFVAVGMPGLNGVGCRLLAPAAARDPLLEHLRSAPISPLSQQAREVLRVEAGLSAVGHELTEDYTPLEVGLQGAVSTSKGCYTGQEIIARQITYDKVAKGLVGLRLSAYVQPGDDVRAEGRGVGAVTSVANSPAFGPIALAVLRHPHTRPGAEVMIHSREGKVPAVIAVLPFTP